MKFKIGTKLIWKPSKNEYFIATYDGKYRVGDANSECYPIRYSEKELEDWFQIKTQKCIKL